MALFKSGNPALSEKRFKDTVLDEVVTHENAMTVKGTLNKFGFLFLMVMGTSFYSWKEFANGGNVQPLIYIGAFGGLGVAILMAFKKQWSAYLAPAYALLEGLFVAAFPPGPEAPPNSNLPAQTTSLLGREADLTHITGLLRDEGTRLVTLTGAGGSGKTRLAIEAAGVLVDELADGVYLVELAALREPELVPGAIATVPGVPAEELDGRLESRELLLVPDNLALLLPLLRTRCPQFD